MATFCIGIADSKVAKSPDTLTTLGLGSCVGLVLYDAFVKVGGMVHIMLPSANGPVTNSSKYADTGLESLLRDVLASGASRSRLYAKMAGGANMFGTAPNNDMLRIGERNVAMCRQLLNAYGIPIRSEETGGSTGRTIEFSCHTGELKIRTAWPRTERTI